MIKRVGNYDPGILVLILCGLSFLVAACGILPSSVATSSPAFSKQARITISLS